MAFSQLQGNEMSFVIVLLEAIFIFVYPSVIVNKTIVC